MTKRRSVVTNHPNCRAIGQILTNHRLQLNLHHTGRQAFIDNRVDIGLMPEGWLSVKSLTNIENGHNLPSLTTIYQLSLALEVGFQQLMREIEPYL